MGNYIVADERSQWKSMLASISSSFSARGSSQDMVCLVRWDCEEANEEGGEELEAAIINAGKQDWEADKIEIY